MEYLNITTNNYMDCSLSLSETSQVCQQAFQQMDYEANTQGQDFTSMPDLIEGLVTQEEYRLALESFGIKEEELEAINSANSSDSFSLDTCSPVPSLYSPSPEQFRTFYEMEPKEPKPYFFHPKKEELQQDIKQQIDEKVRIPYMHYCKVKQELQETYFPVANEEKLFLIKLQRSITAMIQVILQRFGSDPKRRKELTAHLKYLGKYMLLVTKQPTPITLCERKESSIEIALLISPGTIAYCTSRLSSSLVNENKVESARITFNNDKAIKNTAELELKKDKFGIGYFAQASSWKINSKKPKRIEKGGEKESSVLDESFHLQFKCDVHLGSYGTLNLETFSFPFKVLTNISQKDKAIKSVVWERAAEFFGRDIYKIQEKRSVQSLKFGKLVESIRVLVEQETGRALTENDVLLIGNKYFGDELTPQSNISLTQYRESRIILENELNLEMYMEKETSPKLPSKRKRSASNSSNVKSGISFIDWFLLLIKYLRSDEEVLNLWTSGQMYSYLSQEQNFGIFSHAKVGTYIIRLSLSSPIAISIDWLVQENQKTEVACLRWPRKDNETTMGAHKLSVLRHGFGNTCWKYFKAWIDSGGEVPNFSFFGSDLIPLTPMAYFIVLDNNPENLKYINYRRYVTSGIQIHCSFV